MNKIIITAHSFVDLITNSSSELFICDSKKSIESVKEILTKLCEMHNQKVALAGGANIIDVTKLFWDKYDLDYNDPGYSDKYNHIFGTVEVCKYTFNSCPERVEYLRLQDRYDYPCDEYVAGDQKMRKWEIDNKIKQDHTEEEWREHLKKKDEYADVVFAEYMQLCREAFHKLLVVYCSKNNIEYDYVASNLIEDGWGGTVRFQLKGSQDKELIGFINSLNESLSWNYTTEKGQIMIESATDNSIPYWMFEDIEHIFQAQRRHLG